MNLTTVNNDLFFPWCYFFLNLFWVYFEWGKCSFWLFALQHFTVFTLNKNTSSCIEYQTQTEWQWQPSVLCQTDLWSHLISVYQWEDSASQHHSDPEVIWTSAQVHISGLIKVRLHRQPSQSPCLWDLVFNISNYSVISAQRKKNMQYIQSAFRKLQH